MIQLDELLVLTPRFSPTEAKAIVLASWTTDENLPPPLPSLKGRLVGPVCEYATTLSARIPLWPDVGDFSHDQLRASAKILEPCFWEPQHPFCYELYVELHHGQRVVESRYVTTGIRHLEVDDCDLLLNGHENFLQGVGYGSIPSIAELESWHEVDCGVFLADASIGLCERTDRWGPMVLHLLHPLVKDANNQVIQLRNHPSLLMWVAPVQLTGNDLELFVGQVRARDPSRLVGQLVPVDRPTREAGPIDVLLLPAGHPEIGSTSPSKPFIVLARVEAYPTTCNIKNFSDEIAKFRQWLGSPPGLVGVIL